MSAPAHTSSPDGSFTVAARLVATLDRALPYAGPVLALALGAIALGRRALDVDEAAAVAAATGSFSDVVERALSDDPARAGYLALLQPVVAWNDGALWVRVPSVLAGVVAAIAAYRLGRRLAGRHAGAAASLLLASSLGVVLLTRSVGPLPLALAAMLVSSALFARAVDRGNIAWWAVYAVSAALLPLTHPIAASALAAQLVALALARHRVDLRVALPAAGIATVECGLFLVAAALDRADAPDGAGPLELADLGTGVGRAFGWSPVLAGLAVWGLVWLWRRDARTDAWQAALVTGLVAMPAVFVLAAGAALPVFPREALTTAAGGAALAAGIGLVGIGDRALRIAAIASVAAVAVAAIVTAAVEEPEEDWAAAARIARSESTARDTVVVLPPRAAAALRHAAPGLRTSSVGRGEAVTVVIVGDPAQAVAAARQVVSPPRYALLEQRSAGTRVVVQRWVRP